MLNVVMLSVVMLSVIMLSVVMPNVVAPFVLLHNLQRNFDSEQNWYSCWAVSTFNTKADIFCNWTCLFKTGLSYLEWTYMFATGHYLTCLTFED